MQRKPHPKDAAKRIRAYLEKEGVCLSQRKALDLVALVDGHNSWQAMHAATRAEAAPPASAYELLWQEVAPAINTVMAELHQALKPMLRAGVELRGPEFSSGDEYRISIWTSDTAVPPAQSSSLQAEIALVEDEDRAGRYALRFAIEDDTNELVWTSGTNFSDRVWCTCAVELLEALENQFSVADVITAIEQQAFFSAHRC